MGQTVFAPEGLGFLESKAFIAAAAVYGTEAAITAGVAA